MTTSYRDGKKWVDGRAFAPLKLVYNDSKTSRRVYTTIFWEDGLTSCNCQGWATHKHCKHARQLEDQIELGTHGQALQAIRRFPPLFAQDAARRRREPERLINEFARARGFPVPQRSKKERAKPEPPDSPKPYRRIRL